MKHIIYKDWKSIYGNLVLALMYEKLGESGL